MRGSMRGSLHYQRGRLVRILPQDGFQRLSGVTQTSVDAHTDIIPFSSSHYGVTGSMRSSWVRLTLLRTPVQSQKRREPVMNLGRLPLLTGQNFHQVEFRLTGRPRECPHGKYRCYVFRGNDRASQYRRLSGSTSGRLVRLGCFCLMRADNKVEDYVCRSRVVFLTQQGGQD